MTKRNIINIIFGFWLIIPLCYLVMINDRLRAYGLLPKHKPRIAKSMYKTFGLAPRSYRR